MKVIKVSTPWHHINFPERIPSDSGDYLFSFDPVVEECDFWIIWGGIKGPKEIAVCDPANVIYLTDEAHEQRFFNKYFLNQFAAIISCRTDLSHKNVLFSHELNTWMINKTYDELNAENKIEKTKLLSVVCSDQIWLPGHKLRYAFVNRLIGHFKDKIDVFGRGFNPIADKYDALAPYKYSVAIENSSIPGYFTEKIADCYLSLAMPIYYGCPDIEKYFDNNSLLSIDPYHYLTSIQKIEQLIEEDPYYNLLSVLEQQRKKYLEEYHIFNKLPKIISAHFNHYGKKVRIIIENERCFQRGYTLNKFVRIVFKKLHLPEKLFLTISLPQNSSYANQIK